MYQTDSSAYLDKTILLVVGNYFFFSMERVRLNTRHNAVEWIMDGA